MVRPTHEFMGSSQFIIVFFDAEETGGKVGPWQKLGGIGNMRTGTTKEMCQLLKVWTRKSKKKSARVLEMKPWHTDREASHKKASGERECKVCEQDRHKLKTETNWQNLRKILYIILRTGHWDILTSVQCVGAHT